MPYESQVAQKYFEANSLRIIDHLRNVKLVEDVQCLNSEDRTAYLSVVLTSSYDGTGINDVIGDIEAALLSFDVCDNCTNTLDDMFRFVVVQKTNGAHWKYTKIYWLEGLTAPSSEYGGD
ncbi:hypothetical protein F4813DRAFT_400943 [Daldinia decipiens]|uniref:uncharacterized protein n=1 Tax=Daldinia decipiens TaxID=326647 RepID=UPI0020C31309|nr:uncharacterized protein F4813DRAFT_400943 [Daldinia decipiens]KAI1652532.1 hypothetical protein F4813DRAFT_400943 [Daldinia decipiens]